MDRISQTPHEQPAERGISPSSDRRACVLVAEDEDMLRELAMEVLDAHGFDSIGARHGGEALSIFAERVEEIDVVLLDLSMPVLDGATVLGEMRRRKPSVRVVLTSGYDDSADELEEGTAEHPIVSFLQKPYRAEHLISRLRALLATKDN